MILVHCHLGFQNIRRIACVWIGCAIGDHVADEVGRIDLVENQHRFCGSDQLMLGDIGDNLRIVSADAA